jgi:hypothetical protein
VPQTLIQPCQDIEVTPLRGAQDPLPGVILGASGRFLQLRVPAELQPGTPVKVGAADSLLLGHVCQCQREAEGYTAGVIVRHALANLAELERLKRALGETRHP